MRETREISGDALGRITKLQILNNEFDIDEAAPDMLDGEGIVVDEVEGPAGGHQDEERPGQRRAASHHVRRS